LPHTMTRRSVLLGLSLGWPSLGSLAQLQETPELVLSMGGGTPLGPGKSPGFADSVVVEAFRRIGITAEVIPLPAERSLINANAGIEDGDALRTRAIESNYPNLVRVPEQVMLFEVGGYTFDPNLDVITLGDLSDHAVGIEAGIKVVEGSLAEHPRLTAVKDLKQLFTLLSNRRVDIALAERWQGNWWANRLGPDCRILLMPLQREPMFIYLHKRHAALAPRLAAALRDMKADGTHARLFLRILAPLDTAQP